LPRDPDSEDVDRVLAGETEAFAGIVHRWKGPLVRMAHRLCGDRTRAEDLAQEAFLRAYGRLAKWRRAGSFGAWLMALALNSYRSELRKRAWKEVPLEELGDAAQGAEAAPDGGSEELDRVRRAVNALPWKYREAVAACYELEHDMRSAAELLGVPQGTLKARLHRALKLIERALAPRQGA
jgi:RNA polymerase sigma-70 factor (ECF subfamily)